MNTFEAVRWLAMGQLPAVFPRPRVERTEEMIRPDVVTAVRFALASLPEQSRMIDAQGHRRATSHPMVIDANPVYLGPL